MPTGALVTDVVVPPDVTLAEAVIYAAPESLLVALKTTEAMPVVVLPVKSVAEVGVKVTRPFDAAKVTITPFNSVPLASRSVAVTFTGDPYVIEDGTLKTRVGTEVVVVLVAVELEPVLVASSLLPPQAIREQSRVKEISSHNDRQIFFLIDFVMLFSFFIYLKE
jgi:hypothetical protein